MVQAAATARGPIRVAASQELGRMLIAPWAATFLDRYPEVSLELGISDRCVDIIREGFDNAIRMGSLADSDLVSRKIGDIRFVLAASPDYISRNSVPTDLEALGRHVFVRYAASGRPWPYILADGTRLPTSGRFVTDDTGSIREAVICGAGIAYLLHVTVAQDFAEGRISNDRFRETSVGWRTAIIGAKASLTRRGSLFFFNLIRSWTPRFARKRSRSSTWPVKRLLAQFCSTRARPCCGSRQRFHGPQRPIGWCFPAVWKTSAATDWERRWTISPAFPEDHVRVAFPSCLIPYLRGMPTSLQSLFPPHNERLNPGSRERWEAFKVSRQLMIAHSGWSSRNRMRISEGMRRYERD